MQWLLTVAVGGFDVAAGLKENPHRLLLPKLDCFVERRLSVRGLCFQVVSGCNCALQCSWVLVASRRRVVELSPFPWSTSPFVSVSSSSFKGKNWGLDLRGCVSCLI